MLEKKITLASKLIFILLTIAVLSLAGCLEEKSEYTINPDLSGKVTYDLIFIPDHMNRVEPGDAPEQMIKTEIERILRQSKGIDTWSDISFELTDEGLAHFTGTAYFPDINKAFVGRAQVSEPDRFQFTKDKSGRIIIELPHFTDTKKKSEVKRTVKLTEAELTQQVRLAKLQYKQAKPMMLATLGTLKQDSLLHLPAKIEKISNLEKVNDTTVRWKMQGSEMIEAMDKLMSDDQRLKRLIQEGKGPFEDTADKLIFNQIFFGEKGPIQVILSSDSRNLFDYDAEVAVAQGNYDQMLKELKLVLTPAEPVKMPISSSVSAEPGAVTVGGVRLIRYQDREREIKPLHEFEKGYTLSLILELPDPNLIVVKGQVKKAITDTGQDILPERNRETSFPVLSKDGNAAVFEVDLSVPDKDAKAIAELSGTVGYLKSAGTKEIDLGIMDFKEDTPSAVEGFSIRSVGVRSWDKERSEMELRVNLLRGHLVSTKFYREDGTQIEVSSGGISFSGDKLLDIGYRTKGEFPPRGRIVFEVIDKITKHEIEFKLTNISLTGEPLD